MNVTEAMTRIKTLLEANAFLSGVAVLLNGTGLPAHEGGAKLSIAEQIQAALNAKGLVIEVSYVQGNQLPDESISDVAEESTFGVMLFENPAVNHGTDGHGKSTLEAFRNIKTALHYQPLTPAPVDGEDSPGPFDVDRIHYSESQREVEPQTGLEIYDTLVTARTDDIT